MTKRKNKKKQHPEKQTLGCLRQKAPGFVFVSGKLKIYGLLEIYSTSSVFVLNRDAMVCVTNLTTSLLGFEFVRFL